MNTNYCKTYGFDERRRQATLDLLELEEADHIVAQILHKHILAPVAKDIIDMFYAYLLKFTEFNSIITKDDIPALKSTQADYLKSFGVAFDSEEYFNNRLLIGEVHKRVGLTLGLYQCAYRTLQQLMLDAIPDDFEVDGVTGRNLCCLIHKLVSLDMTLAIETYHLSSMNEMSESIDELRSEGDDLRKKVTTDNLTGLATREHALNILEKHMTHTGHSLCVIMADIDNFKTINDTHGHLAGDEVLRKISQCFGLVVREFDIVSRYGGEEFLIVLTQASTKIAMKVAERIQTKVKEARIEYGGHTLSVCISQGVARVEEEDTPNKVLQRADAALYLAKVQGRDRIIMDVNESNVTGR